MEISAQIALARRWRIYEIGIRYFGRTYAEGKKINWKDGLKALWYLIRFRFEPASGRPLSAPAIVLNSLGLFVLLLAVYAASPVITFNDSRWSIHTAMSFAHGDGGDLTESCRLSRKSSSMPLSTRRPAAYPLPHRHVLAGHAARRDVVLGASALRR